MHFQKFAPPDNLHAFIRYFWTLESEGEVEAAETFTTLADGCPGLIIQRAADVPFRDATAKPWPRSFLYGQTTRATAIGTAGPFRTLGVCFQPNALSSVFGLNAAEWTNTCLDLTLLASPGVGHLAEQLENCHSVSDQLDVLANFLRASARRNEARQSHPVRYLLACLVDSRGRASLPALQGALGLSERSLQRQFKHGVGISPQLFARICRFQASLAQLRTRQYDKLSDIAFEQDYADQSHHIRAFREFAGASPRQVRQRAGQGPTDLPELLR